MENQYSKNRPTTRPRQTTPRQTTLVAPQLDYRIVDPGQVEILMQHCYKHVNDKYSRDPIMRSKLTGILNNYIIEGGTQILINTLHTFKNVLNSVNDNDLNTIFKENLFMDVDMPDSFGKNN